MKRKNLSRKKSKAIFSRGADRRHRMNSVKFNPRGGRKLT